MILLAPCDRLVGPVQVLGDGWDDCIHLHLTSPLGVLRFRLRQEYVVITHLPRVTIFVILAAVASLPVIRWASEWRWRWWWESTGFGHLVCPAALARRMV